MYPDCYVVQLDGSCFGPDEYKIVATGTREVCDTRLAELQQRGERVFLAVPINKDGT